MSKKQIKWMGYIGNIEDKRYSRLELVGFQGKSCLLLSLNDYVSTLHCIFEHRRRVQYGCWTTNEVFT